MELNYILCMKGNIAQHSARSSLPRTRELFNLQRSCKFTKVVLYLMLVVILNRHYRAWNVTELYAGKYNSRTFYHNFNDIYMYVAFWRYILGTSPFTRFWLHVLQIHPVSSSDLYSLKHMFIRSNLYFSNHSGITFVTSILVHIH